MKAGLLVSRTAIRPAHTESYIRTGRTLRQTIIPSHTPSSTPVDRDPTDRLVGARGAPRIQILEEVIRPHPMHLRKRRITSPEMPGSRRFEAMLLGSLAPPVVMYHTWGLTREGAVHALLVDVIKYTKCGTRTREPTLKKYTKLNGIGHGLAARAVPASQLKVHLNHRSQPEGGRTVLSRVVRPNQTLTQTCAGNQHL